MALFVLALPPKVVSKTAVDGNSLWWYTGQSDRSLWDLKIYGTIIYHYNPLPELAGFFPNSLLLGHILIWRQPLLWLHDLHLGVNFVSISGCRGLTICLPSVLCACFLSASRWWRLSFVFPNCLWWSPFPTYFLYCAWMRMTHDRSSLSLHFLPGAPLIHTFLFILKKKQNRDLFAEGPPLFLVH